MMEGIDMDAETKPADVELAERIVRAAGIDATAITDAAETNLDRLTALDRSDAKDRGEQPTDPRELWTKHSAKTLCRFFAKFCLTCNNWTPDDGRTGKCTVLPQALGYKGPAPADALLGCTLYEEIPIAEMDTINARTELAFALTLLTAYPGGDEPEPEPEPAIVTQADALILRANHLAGNG